MGNTFDPNGFSIGSSRHISSSKYPQIVLHEGDEPDALADLCHADGLAVHGDRESLRPDRRLRVAADDDEAGAAEQSTHGDHQYSDGTICSDQLWSAPLFLMVSASRHPLRLGDLQLARVARL